MEYLYILLTILLTVYGQLVIKWRILKYGLLPIDLTDKVTFLLNLLVDPFIISGFFAAFFAALFWMAAMTKLDISHAYPFMALSFVLVLVLSGVFLNEAITLYKVIGISLVILGIAVGSQG